jgi:hypothetical protein
MVHAILKASDYSGGDLVYEGGYDQVFKVSDPVTGELCLARRFTHSMDRESRREVLGGRADSELSRLAASARRPDRRRVCRRDGDGLYAERESGGSTEAPLAYTVQGEWSNCVLENHLRSCDDDVASSRLLRHSPQAEA